MRKMIRKILAAWYVFSRTIIFRCQKEYIDDFWAWLYVRVSDSKSWDFARPELVAYLLFSALRVDEYVRVTTVYSEHLDIFKDRLTKRQFEKVNTCIARAADEENIFPRPYI